MAAMARGEVPPPPVAQLVGFRPVATGEGYAVLEFEAQPRHHNPMGTVHGGILCDVADAAVGFAYATALKDGETFTTVELKIDFLRPVRAGRLVATARVVKRGRTLGLVECDVTDRGGSLVARASSTCMTLRDEAGRGDERTSGRVPWNCVEVVFLAQKTGPAARTGGAFGRVAWSGKVGARRCGKGLVVFEGRSRAIAFRGRQTGGAGGW